MTGAQFEIRIDGTPRTYRDRKDYAMEAARLIKSKNPHSMVEVKPNRAKFSRQLKRISVLMDSVVRVSPPQPRSRLKLHESQDRSPTLLSHRRRAEPGPDDGERCARQRLHHCWPGATTAKAAVVINLL
jgi:hypothetical protein